MKFQDDISLQHIKVAKFLSAKFRKRAITKKTSYDFFSIFHHSVHHPLSAETSFKFLALIFLDI